MPAIQPLSPGRADEMLGTIWVQSSICHGQDARTCIFQDKVLIIKFLPINGLVTSAVMACEVTTLAQKLWNNSVKAENFLTKSFSPVLGKQRFSAVFGTLFASSSKEMQPKCLPLMVMWKITVGLLMEVSGQLWVTGTSAKYYCFLFSFSILT